METRRPGIYTGYTVSSLYTGRSRRYAALACAGVTGAGEAAVYQSYTQARAALTGEQDSLLLSALGVLFACGVSRVICYPVGASPTAADYTAAFAALGREENVGVLLCDSGEEPVLQALKASVLASSQNRRERIGLAACASPQQAVNLAAGLNCERVLLCCGSAKAGGETGHPVLLAASLAGVILSGGDPSLSLNGRVLPGLTGLERSPSEEEVELLLGAGVTPAEWVGGSVECISAITTRTHTDGVPDATYRQLSTVLIIDDLLISVRTALKERLQGLKNTPQTRESIASQVTVELAAKQEQGLLEGFDPPVVYQNQEDPGLCMVELAVRVAHVIDQILILAQIQV